MESNVFFQDIELFVVTLPLEVVIVELQVIVIVIHDSLAASLLDLSNLAILATAHNLIELSLILSVLLHIQVVLGTNNLSQLTRGP